MIDMLEESSELIGLQVYTKEGMFLGTVDNVVMDIEEGKVDGMFVGDTNPLLVEEAKSALVPFRWVSAVGDIVLLGHFPERISFSEESEE
ncbi:MAG: PRC-barrel domain-containing protein [Candidatus Thermoplasmatota archaeon]|nr:PRC-barrel domain-containing protein [Candidatus Thermoplasmatota archaeon]